MTKHKTATTKKNPSRNRPTGRKRTIASEPLGKPVGFCPVCGRTDIPRGLKMVSHLETHDLSVTDIDPTGTDEYGDAIDRFEPGVKEYRRVMRKAFQGAIQVNELFRIEGLKDERKDVSRPKVRNVRWDPKLERLVVIE